MPDAWVLALVEVSLEGPADHRIRHLRRPFGDTIHLPFSITATMLSWPDYWQRGLPSSD